MKAILETKNLVKYYGTGENLVKAIDHTDIRIEPGEFVAVVGRSGSGKSTLLHMLGGLDRPDSGKVLIEGRDIFRLKDEKLAVFRRRKIGFIFQDYYLMDSLTVRENMILPMILDKADSAEMKKRAEKYAEQFEISHLLDKKPTELSGGEKQRAAICRALINDPELILADEPTGNLDSKSGKIVLDALKEINRWGKTIIMVTHDPQMASNCKHVILLKDGVILKTLDRKGDDEKERERYYREILGEMEQL